LAVPFLTTKKTLRALNAAQCFFPPQIVYVRVCRTLPLQANLRHLLEAIDANMFFPVLGDPVHVAAKHAFGAITLQQDMIAGNQYFDGVALIHFVSFPQRFGQNDAAQLVDLAHYASRSHLRDSPRHGYRLNDPTSCDFHLIQFDEKFLIPSFGKRQKSYFLLFQT
jgi:hypothetical protein